MSNPNGMSSAMAINNSGQVTGFGTIGVGQVNVSVLGFFYDGRQMQTIHLPGDSGDMVVCGGLSLDDSGEVVGYYRNIDSGVSFAMYDANGKVVDLNTLVGTVRPECNLDTASYIDNDGQILARATVSGVQQQYLLTPVPGVSSTPDFRHPLR